MHRTRGDALLVGGSGKQSLTKLACFASGYGEAEFHDYLKRLYAILAERACAFLLTGTHVMNESFLESILRAGWLPKSSSAAFLWLALQFTYT